MSPSVNTAAPIEQESGQDRRCQRRWQLIIHFLRRNLLGAGEVPFSLENLAVFDKWTVGSSANDLAIIR